MKTTDIKVGTYYAVYDSKWGINNYALGRDSSNLKRAKVLRLKGTLQTGPSWNRRPQHGIVVQEKDGQPFVVQARQVFGTWADHLRRRDELAEIAKEAKADKAKAFHDTAAAVAHIKQRYLKDAPKQLRDHL